MSSERFKTVFYLKDSNSQLFKKGRKGRKEGNKLELEDPKWNLPKSRTNRQRFRQDEGKAPRPRGSIQEVYLAGVVECCGDFLCQS